MSEAPKQERRADPHTGWTVVDDNGAEFVSPVLAAQSYHQVGDVLAAIKATRGVVQGPYRGLHIHLDAKSLTADNLLHIIDAFYHGEVVWHRLAGTSEQRRCYCEFLHKRLLEELSRSKPKSKQDILEVWNKTMKDRNYGLNFYAIEKHGTIELRLFEANDDPAYMDRSVALAQQLVTEAVARGKFVDWHRFSDPAERSEDAGMVLDALGFAASSKGLGQMRSKLLEKFALRPGTHQ